MNDTRSYYTVPAYLTVKAESPEEARALAAAGLTVLYSSVGGFSLSRGFSVGIPQGEDLCALSEAEKAVWEALSANEEDG